MKTPQELRQELARLEGQEPALDSQLRNLAADYAALQAAKDRLGIARTVIYTYAGAVAAALLYLLVEGWKFRQPVFANIGEVIKIAVLPVTFLVLGFYFGSNKRD